MPKVQQPRETRVHHVTLQPDTTAQRALGGDVTAPNGSEHGEVNGPLLDRDGSLLIGPDGIAGADVALDDAGRQRASVTVTRRQFDASPHQMQRRGPFGVSHLQRAERQCGFAPFGVVVAGLEVERRITVPAPCARAPLALFCDSPSCHPV